MARTRYYDIASKKHEESEFHECYSKHFDKFVPCGGGSDASEERDVISDNVYVRDFLDFTFAAWRRQAMLQSVSVQTHRSPDCLANPDTPRFPIDVEGDITRYSAQHMLACEEYYIGENGECGYFDLPITPIGTLNACRIPDFPLLVEETRAEEPSMLSVNHIKMISQQVGPYDHIAWSAPSTGTIRHDVNDVAGEDEYRFFDAHSLAVQVCRIITETQP